MLSQKGSSLTMKQNNVPVKNAVQHTETGKDGTVPTPIFTSKQFNTLYVLLGQTHADGRHNVKDESAVTDRTKWHCSHIKKRL